MRLAILCNRDIASSYVLGSLLPQLQTHCCTVFVSDSVGKPSSLFQLQQLQFFERYFFEQLLTKERRQLIQHSAKIHLEHNINSEKGFDLFQQFRPDFVLSIRYGHILKPTAIRVPRYGVINLHSGLLPKFRGVMATFWAMLLDEKIAGTTLHFIEDARIDNGAIIDYTTTKLNYNCSYLENMLALYPPVIDALLQQVALLENGQTISSKKPLGKGAYYGFPKAENLQHFIDKQYTFVNVDSFNRFIQKNRFCALF